MPSRLYQLLINLLLPFAMVYWVKQFIKHKVPWVYFKERLGYLPDLPQQAIWIHAASIGELNVAKTIIMALKTTDPVILSCSTSKGFVRQKTDFFLPFDHKKIIQHTYKTLNPKALILIETELWPNLIQQATCPVYLVNARLSEKSFKRYNQIGALMKKTLPHLTGVWCSSAHDAKRLTALGATISCVHPNIKYLSSPLKPLQKTTQIQTFVFSCTHPGEEAILLPTFKTLLQKDTHRIVIIPRHPHRADAIKKIIRPLGDKPIIVEARFGCTDEWYSKATAVFMGGSFVPHGGQNPLEPLRYDCPCFIGPHYHNFTAVVESLKNTDLITVVSEPKMLEDYFMRPLKQPNSKPFFAHQQQRVDEALTLLHNAINTPSESHLMSSNMGIQEN